MQFKTWHAIDPPPTPAELELKAAAEAGEFCTLGPDDEIPEDLPDWSAAPPDRLIRAEVLRVILLRLDGCTTTEKGLALVGAYISGTLDLTDCTIPGNLLLYDCRLEQKIRARRTKWTSDLRLETCALPALDAAGATIGGQLDCMGATFNTPKGKSLNLQGAEVKQTLFLRAATLNGTAHLTRAKIGGQLDCEGATFNTPKGISLHLQGAEIKQTLFLRAATVNGTADLTSAKIGGWLSCVGATFDTPDGRSLTLHGTTITGGLILRNGTRIAGLLDLIDAHTTTLVDDGKCWPPGGELILDGFTYDRIDGPPDIKTRLDWLARGDRWNDTFYPQPYKQLAKVLHDTGHEAEAQEILFTLATKLAAERRMEIRKQIEGARPFVPNLGLAIGLRLRLGAETVADTLLRSVVGYGRKPFRSLGWLVTLIALCWVFALGAWHRGDFAPNSAVILQSTEWRSLTDHPNAAQHWAETSRTGRDWESFHPLAYAADVVIPIVDLGQTEAWAPSTERGPWGAQLWYWRWFFIALGWIVTALGAAALTGIIRRE